MNAHNLISPEQQREAEAGIQRLLWNYTVAADAYSADALAACFTEDGVLDRPDGKYEGRAAIAAAIRNPAGNKRRHLFQPPSTRFESPVAANGSGYCLLLEYDSASNSQRVPVPVDYHDEYRFTEAGWQLQRRQVRPSFR